MLVALRLEPVAEAQELTSRSAPDCRPAHRFRDDLVLYGSDAERRCLPSEGPARWQARYAPVWPRAWEVRRGLPEAFRLVHVTFLVDTRRGGLLQTEEARPQNINGEVMAGAPSACPGLLLMTLSYAGSAPVQRRLALRPDRAAVPHSPWPRPFAPRCPPRRRPLCSPFATSTGPTSSSHSSSATASWPSRRQRPGHDWRGRRWRSPVPVQKGFCACHVGSTTTRGSPRRSLRYRHRPLPSVGRKTAPRTCSCRSIPRLRPPLCERFTSASRDNPHHWGQWFATPSPVSDFHQSPLPVSGTVRCINTGHESGPAMATVQAQFLPPAPQKNSETFCRRTP